jgi:hypothetical protein
LSGILALARTVFAARVRKADFPPKESNFEEEKTMGKMDAG